MKNLSLAGQNILITRAEKQSASYAKELEALGAKVFEIPLIQIQAILNQNLEALFLLSRPDYILFTSQNAIQVIQDTEKNFFKRIQQSEVKKIVVGQKTLSTLKPYLKTSEVITPSENEQNVKGILKTLENSDVQNKTFLYLGAQNRSLDLESKLTVRGAKVIFVPVYQTASNFSSKKVLQQLLSDEQIHWIFLCSPSAVKAFFELTKDQKNTQQTSRLLSIGPKTSSEICNFTQQTFFEAETPSIEGFISTIQKHL